MFLTRTPRLFSYAGRHTVITTGVRCTPGFGWSRGPQFPLFLMLVVVMVCFLYYIGPLLDRPDRFTARSSYAYAGKYLVWAERTPAGVPAYAGSIPDVRLQVSGSVLAYPHSYKNI